jgi:hypothetical protein
VTENVNLCLNFTVDYTWSNPSPIFAKYWFSMSVIFQGRRNTFQIGGAEFLEAPPWLAPSGKFFEN